MLDGPLCEEDQLTTNPMNRKRQGNRPDRRIADEDLLSREARDALAARIRYVGIAHHKLRPGDYDFEPPFNPRPSKAVCDDLGPILIDKAKALFREGIRLGMVSPYSDDGVPKYVWAVDGNDEVYEAKTRPEGDVEYHGYRLSDDDRDMRRHVLKEWKRRCNQT